MKHLLLRQVILMATSTHAILSASAAHRWLECTPSARLSENFEDTTSVYALEGTVVHQMCEIKLCKALGLECDEKLPDDFEKDFLELYTEPFIKRPEILSKMFVNIEKLT